MDKLTPEQEARKTYLFFKPELTREEREELHNLLGMPQWKEQAFPKEDNES